VHERSNIAKEKVILLRWQFLKYSAVVVGDTVKLTVASTVGKYPILQP